MCELFSLGVTHYHEDKDIVRIRFTRYRSTVGVTESSRKESSRCRDQLLNQILHNLVGTGLTEEKKEHLPVRGNREN